MRPIDWVWLAVAALWSGLILVEVGRRHRAGPVLLDLGSGLRDRYHLWPGVLLAVVGATMPLLSWRTRLQGLAYCAWGAGVLVSVTRRLQFRQAGIFGRKLYRWEDIAEYYFSEKGGLSLKLTDTGWTHSIGMPYAQRAAVREFLAEKLHGRAQHTVV